jgi:hypothetical protein
LSILQPASNQQIGYARMNQPAPPSTNRRPEFVTLIAVYQLVTAAILFLLSCMIPAVVIPSIFVYVEVSGGIFAALIMAGGGLALFLGFGIASLVVGWGLFRMREWARLGAIVLAAFALIGFPVWTIVAILILVYLTSEDARNAFKRTQSSREADELAARAAYKTESVPRPASSSLEDTRPMKAATGTQITSESPASLLSTEETHRIEPIPMPPPQSEQPTAKIELGEPTPALDEPKQDPERKWVVPAEEAGMDSRILRPREEDVDSGDQRG